MQWQGWYCIAVVAVGVLIMSQDVMGPDFAMMGMLICMMAAPDTVTLKDGLAGFSNEGLLTVAILFVMAAGISETGGLDYFFAQLLGTPASTEGALVRMMLPIMCISAFLNNTPVVAIMIPIIVSWARQAGIAPGHLFMPLSFASILGGTITLIGTSTNLVVAGKQRETFPDQPPIGLFGLSLYGVPVAIAGCIYIVLFGPRLLPGTAKKRRKSGEADDYSDAFLVGLRVMQDSPAISKTVGDAGLRGLSSIYLTSVKRGGSVIHAVGPDFIILRDDVLFFAGELSRVKMLVDRFKFKPVADAFEEDLPAMMGTPRRAYRPATIPEGDEEGALSHQIASLTDPLDDSVHPFLPHPDSTVPQSPRTPGGAALSRPSGFPQSRLYSAKVKASAPDLDGVTVRDAHFRSNFNAAIVSIRRQGVQLNNRFGDVRLQAGDELFFDAGIRFTEDAEAVKSNLTAVQTVKDDSEREFMFAFVVTDRGAANRANGSTTNLSEMHNVSTGSNARRDANASAEAPESAADRDGMSRTSSGGVRGFQRSVSGIANAVSAFARGSAAGGLVGKTIEKAGLRGLPDVFLVAIERGEQTLHAVEPTEELQAGDVLWFAGSTAGVISLRKIPGLAQVDDQVDKLSTHVLDRRLVQVVLSRNSDLLGKTVRDTRFRTRFDAAIIALHREGERVRSRIGDVELCAGDVLLLDTGAQFLQNHKVDRNFALVAEVANSAPPRFDRVAIAVICSITAIVLYIAGVLELFTSAAFAVAIMLLTGCLSGEAARRAVKWDVIITIAAAFGISNAMENTGAAKAIADLLVSAGSALGGNVSIQIAVYIATVLLSNIVANNAAAALMFPIAANVALSQGIDTELMSYLLMLAASASFAVPFGYQTNLMVYGAGGYTFFDFVRFGGPMQLWQGVASCAVILLADYWYIVWTVSAIAAFVVFLGPALADCWRLRHAAFSRPAMHRAGSSAVAEGRTEAQISENV